MTDKPFALGTGDPAFDPHAPVTINGFLFVPAPTPREAAHNRLSGHRYVAPPRPAFAELAKSCRPRREGDEMVCATPGCAKRWDAHEDAPDCSWKAKS